MNRRVPPSGGYGDAQYNSQGYRRDYGASSSYMNQFHKAGQKRKAVVDDDSYFDDDDTTVNEDENIIDACPFLTEEDKLELKQKQNAKDEDDDEEDPLDAFMAGIQDEVKNQTEKPNKPKKSDKGIRDDLEELDSDELYYKYVKDNPNAGKMFLDEEEEVEYDDDGNKIIPNKKLIDPLPVIYHSEIEYPSFEKNFYQMHEEIEKLNYLEVKDLREKLNIQVSGLKPPKPVTSFGHLGFDDKLLSAIRKQHFTNPTPIQAQGVPTVLSGRDVIGIAQTGSGKTAAFLWPLLVHIMDQPQLEKKDGPIGLIVAPTRELCQQIHQECRKFGRVFNIQTCCCFGGGNMYEQQKALTAGCEIVVATPGRLIDHVKKENTNLRRVTYLVFDEADRMFEMGFEYQVRSIANHIRPDRQTLLFSATFRHRIERLARDVLIDPIRITQGNVGVANTDVTQIVEVFKHEPDKWKWLLSHFVQFTSEGSLLIFVTKKLNAEELAGNLKNNGYDVTLIHGDMNQFIRNEVISNFKKLQVSTLVATDVAARGLDIPSIKNVVNYDVARDIDTHTHRVGRTGRAGQKGRAYTLVTNRDQFFAGDLVRHLEDANQFVPPPLLNIAMQNNKFGKSRYKESKGKNISKVMRKERPGLGLPESSAKKPKPPPSSGGVLGGRASSVKDYFRAQYKSNFVGSRTAASEETWNCGTSHPDGGFKHPQSASLIPQQKKKRKSRWDTSTD